MTVPLFLNISERMQAIGTLNKFRGSLDELSILLKDVDKLRPTDLEWETVGKSEEISTDDSGKRIIKITWDDDKYPPQEIALDLKTVQALNDLINSTEEGDGYQLGQPNIEFLISLKSKLV